MTLSRVRNVVLVLGLASLVGGIVMTFTEKHEDTEITIGEHTTRSLGGLTFNIDTIISTLVAAGVVLLLGFLARRALTKDPDDHVPTKLQLLWETVVNQVNTQVEDNLGKVHPFVAPLAISLFFFILFANWLEILPTELNHDTHLLPAPTADTNLTYALALVTIVSVWAYGIQQKGVKGYFKHFFEPFPVMFPLNLLEELIKPVTLALRLFGNIFAGGIMLALITLMPAYILWAPNLLWKGFDAAIGVIQAFIFALLTVLYFAMAGAGHGDEHHDEHDEKLDEEHADAPEVDKVPVPT
jgi:F-type H+-transporting ATPase subunit a